MKRVYCLYRVSTKKQVDKNNKDENDIPMQKKACHEFADRQNGWTILKEFSEQGISGYKVSAKDRDAIQELKEAVQRKEFDILLVFMFDRIGSIKVNRILRDPYYCGRLEDGTTSPQLESLRLRNDDTYDQILYILGQRQNKNEEKRHIALQTRGQAMLSGNIFCAHCGGRLTTMRYRDSYTRADGTKYSVNEIKYCCYHKSRKLCQCDGQTTYRAERVDESVRQVIRKLFSGMDGAPEEEKLQAALKRQMAGNRAAQKKFDRELIKDRERLAKLQLEIGKTLTGESSYSADDLSQAIRTIKARIEDAEIKLTQLKDEEEQERQGIEQIAPAYDRFKSWAEEFDTATLEQQKMIACHLFKRIEVGRGYQIKAELNMTYKQFYSEWGGGDLLGEVIG